MKKINKAIGSINLNSFCSKDDINYLKKYMPFKYMEGAPFFEKNELILKFIYLAIEKFEQESDKVLTKCFKWVHEQLQRKIENKPDDELYRKIEKMENSDPQIVTSLGWLREYSNVDKGNASNKQTNKRRRGSFGLNRKPTVAPAMKRKSLETSLTSKEVSKILTKLDDKELNIGSEFFNIFTCESKVGSKAILPVISFFAFDELDLLTIIRSDKFEKFVFEISSGYHRENPYHNDLHAADMVQTLFVYITKTNAKEVLELVDLDIASLFLSAIIHDYGHPGLSNDYLINTKNEIAIKYNDVSVLENYHVAETFSLIAKKKECNIFDTFSDEDYRQCRKNIITCVLETDMKKHNSKLEKMKERLISYHISKAKNLTEFLSESNPHIYYNTKIDFLSFLMHSADISNPTKPLNVYKLWAKKCLDEFFKQGDIERQKGMQISFNCDRNTVHLPKSQLGFIEFIVYPLFSILCEFFPQLDYTLKNMDKNSAYFRSVITSELTKKFEHRDTMRREEEERERKEKEQKEKEEKEKEKEKSIESEGDDESSDSENKEENKVENKEEQKSENK